MNIKDCFFYAPEGVSEHLYTLIYLDEKLGLALNATTKVDFIQQDETCILEETDHQSLTRTSIIFYEKPLIREKQFFIDYPKKHPNLMRKPMEQTVFDRIKKGAFNSNDFPEQWLHLCE